MLQALLLTLLGAAGTGIGGLVVVIQPCMGFKRLGALQGLAAGLMLSISLIDLLPEAVEEIGFIPANLCFYAGVLFFALIVAVIPEPHAVAASEQPHVAPQQHAANGSLSSSSDPPDLAACRQSKLPGHQSTAHAAGAEGTPGTQGGLRHRSNIAQPEAAEAAAASISPAAAALCTPSRGCTLTASGKLGKPPQQQQQPAGQLSPQSPVSSQATSTDLQVLLQEDAPSRDISRRNSSKQEDNTCVKQQLLMSGLITAVGIALHNFPEGIAVLLASHKSTAVGCSLACAIALHNIPEGVAVALPVYFATGSRWKGLQTAVLSGLAEPLAVVLLGLVLPFIQLSKHVVDGMLAGVGGIMAFLAFHELLPLSMQHAGVPVAVGCLFCGMGVMSFMLHCLTTHVLADLH